MAKIITENFRVETASELFNSLKNENTTLSDNFLTLLQSYNTDNTLGLSSANTTDIQDFVDAQLTSLRPESHYYIMASSIDKANVISNTQIEKRLFTNRVIFGNRITDNDVRYMFYKNNWTSGIVYDDFDDMEDVTTSNTVVTVPDIEGNYTVFKCIENNYDRPSTITPVFSGIVSSSDEFIVTADGYVWKYLFYVTASDATIYQTSDSLPLPYPAYGDVNVISAARETVSQIIIESTPINQFSAYLFGPNGSNTNASDVTVFSQAQSGTTKNVVVDITPKVGFSLYSTDDAYANMYLKISESGELYNVVASSYASATQIRLTITTEVDIPQNTLCQLLPKIIVSESTLSGSPCLAHGILDQFGTLVRIGFRSKGTEYKIAKAQVAYPKGLTATSPTVLRCVVSPRGGHGSEPVHEMAMSRLVIITNFSGVEGIIPDANSYTKVGLVKNPEFSDAVFVDSFDNRASMTIAGDVTGTALAGHVIQQYLKDSSVTTLYPGNSYVITDFGTTTQSLWNIAAGTSGVVYKLGDAFVAVSVTSGTGVVSHYKFAPTAGDVIDEGDEVITAKIHQSVYDSGLNSTTIYMVDYVGAFENKFQNGTIYIRTSLTATSAYTLSINNASTDVVYGKYVAYTGDLLHYIDFDPITRQIDRKEKIKFIFDF